MTNWVIPCNERVYDHRGAFDKLTAVDWRQSTNINVGDQVFIYVGKPTCSIMYKCEAILTNITEDDYTIINDSEFDRVKHREQEPIKLKYMRLRLLERYPEGLYPKDEVMKNGLRIVRGPSRVYEKFVEYINTKKEILSEIDDTGKKIEGYNKETLAKVRINQSAFRTILLKKCKTCCLCGVQNQDFLIASHIKPWSNSNPYEKTEVVS